MGLRIRGAKFEKLSCTLDPKMLKRKGDGDAECSYAAAN
jgi:hypothetical protein